MNTRTPETLDKTLMQLNSALRLAAALATVMGDEHGTRARETKLALRAADALQELKDSLESGL